MTTVVDAIAVERRIEEEGEEIIDDDEEEEEEEGEDDEDDVEEEEEEDEGDHCEVTVGRRSGRGLTLKTLLKERVLEPGEGNMTINYLGNKFKGDLLPDGRIRSQETNKIFGTPSAWAIYCKKIVNPDKKSGCGWASVRYRGKKLDSYKNNWYRQKRLEYEKEEEEMEEEESESESEEASPHEQEIIEFELLGNRDPNHESSTMIELGTFQAIGRMQPFNITMSSSAMAVIDVHAHLTMSEVVGYLAGQWDVNNHNLIVSHAFPVRCRLADGEKGPAVEQELYAEMARLKLSLVGWYHTHPTSPPLPTLRDIDSQLDYEMRMKGYNDASYTPVLGIIVSPYQKAPLHDRGIPHPNGNATGFWVMPPPENKPLEYGRPMSMQFTVVQDAFIPKEALLHMSEVVKYYKDVPDSIELTDIFENKYTYWHKLKSSLRGRVPKDHYQPLIDFLTKVIDKKLPEDDPIPIPPPVVPATTASLTSSIVTIATTSALSATNLPPSTSISVVESKKSSGDHLLPSTKDLESCVANILKSTIGSDLPSTASLADILSKERESSVIISPAFSSNGSDKYGDDQLSSLTSSVRPKSMEGSSSSSVRAKSIEGKTSSPKTFSPLFQLPMPPLFSLDSSKPIKESQHLKSTYQPLNLLMDEKKHGEFSSPRARSPLSKIEKSHIDELTAGGDLLSGSSKYDMPSSSGFLDLSKDRKSLTEDSKKEKDGKLAPMEMPSWFTQAKLMQEAFVLPPHERDNPFARSSSPATHRDIPPLFPSEFLSPHWNHSLKAGFHPSLAFNDSKPTYHSDVPLLLKKQQEESLKESKLGHRDIGHEAKDFIKKSIEEHLHRDFRMPPPEYKEHKESKDSREGINKNKEIRDRPREMRAPYDEREREFKEPKLFKDPKDLRTERHELTSKEIRDEKISHAIRDLQDLGKRDFREMKKDQYYDRMEHDKRDFRDKETKEGRDFREDKLPKTFETKDSRDSRGSLDTRDTRDFRESREAKEQRETKDYRDMMEAYLREHRDRELREINDARLESLSKEEVRDLRKSYDTSEVKKDFRDSERDISISLMESGNAKESEFKSGTPMDMTTFKIKRDILNPDGRHFIEPGIKRIISDQQNISMSESSRSYLDSRDSGRSSKDTVINLAASSSHKDAFEPPLLPKERIEGTFIHPLSRNTDSKEMKNFEPRESSEPKDPVPKAVINLRDPKTLYEKRDYRDLNEKSSDDLKLDRIFPQPQRRIFTPADDIEGGESSANTSAVYIPHTPTSDEPMDYD